MENVNGFLKSIRLKLKFTYNRLGSTVRNFISCIYRDVYWLSVL